MKPTWFIQTKMEGVDVGPLITEVCAQGFLCRLHREQSVQSINTRGFDELDCVICYGSIDFIHRVQRSLPNVIPGTWCNFNNMKCSIYYAYLGEYLLNQNHHMMPVSELLRRWDKFVLIHSLFTEKELFFMKPTFVAEPPKSLFVRPDSGAKPFTGFVVEHGDKHKIESLIQSIGPETLVVVSIVQNITAEWRYVICDRKIVAGSRYLPDESEDHHAPSFRLADTIASQEWQPDLCYTVDIATSGGKMYLLEINSFSCSAFYSCDLASIVKFASLAAEKEWREYCDPNA